MKVQWGLYTSDLFSALMKTLEYTVLGFVGAVLLGLALALMRRSQTRVVRLPAGIYTELFKNIPLLAIIFITYFGLGSIGLRLSALAAGSLSLVIFYAAYLSEIFRAALGGVPCRQARPGETAPWYRAARDAKPRPDYGTSRPTPKYGSTWAPASSP
jgi:His/Glu/Gln/Arg/opine family amino acid ABC transporter permease subunit